MNGSSHSRSAFTLVELSIALVIIGLLVGGILAGQGMIKAGKLRGAMSEYQQYTTAMNSFKTKYNGWPGDLHNATRYWGAQAGGTTPGVDATCADLVIPYTGVATCNGNGNNRIAENDSDANGTDDRDQWYEMYRGWQHLVNAGMIEGFYTGGTDRRAWNANPGVNVPKSKIHRKAGWIMRWFPDLDEYTGYYFALRGGNFLLLGTGDEAAGPAMTPEEAWHIDSKVDDGKPGTGDVHTQMLTLNPGCITADVITADYNFSEKTVACSFIIRF